MNNFSLEDIWEMVGAVKKLSPIIHNITNLVVMNTTANALLAFGASPIMAHDEREIEDILDISHALVINIGTLSQPWVLSMQKAITAATVKKIPIIIDPVGAGASSLRTKTAIDLISMAASPLIRGNASEIAALAGNKFASRGVDSSLAPQTATESARSVAKNFKTTVCISGDIDSITDGTLITRIRGGSALMPKITGMGCTATALAGAIAGANPHQTGMAILTATMAVMATAGSMAEQKSTGPGTFSPAFLDALHMMALPDLKKYTLLTS